MAAALTPREQLALDAAFSAGGLIRGRSGFYPGFTTMSGPAHGHSTVRALVARGLLARPHGSPARRIITPVGVAVLTGGLSLPDAPPPSEPARPRAYVD